MASGAGHSAKLICSLPFLYIPQTTSFPPAYQARRKGLTKQDDIETVKPGGFLKLKLAAATR
jgi:hypothetical protein